ncbi:MAG: hypothetical protein J4O01_03915 [Chloroflexi bacterium]|nr:hypothetical protein [Chloroflexota bacterium]MCH7983390.1 hypothetical protein [Chloroflexota bacterium]MCH8114407.1 hypothetical protein [Chloroflexota bacterium]MCH8229814.1 hypothetical protein [Chloroflexota bacterium]MCH8909809.1 hypothetical protein [Chloroflexota bacterium]
MTLYDARRNQLIIAGISTILLAMLWTVSDLPRSMYYTLPFIIAGLWIPALLVRKQLQGSLAWNLFFGVLGIAVISTIVRVVWLIGRG